MKRRYQLGLVILLLLTPAAVWGYYEHQLKLEIEASRALEAKVFAELPRAQQLNGMRERLKGMTDEARRDHFRSSMQARKQQMEERMSEYFQLSDGERIAYLDKRIAEDQKRSRERKNRGPREASRRGNRTERFGEQKSPEEREARREQGKRRMLDNTTPEFRAQMSLYRTQLNERRKQRGLPPITRKHRG